MAAGVEGPGGHRLAVVPDEWVTSEENWWYATLPNAVGTFTGHFYLTETEIEKLSGKPPALIPVEVDTHDQPNPVARLPRGTVLSFTIGGRRWQFQVDHTSHAGGNRWIAWCYRDSIQEVTDGQGPGPGPVL